MSAIGTKMKSCAVAMLVIGGTLQTSALPSRLAMPSDIRFEGIETGAGGDRPRQALEKRAFAAPPCFFRRDMR